MTYIMQQVVEQPRERRMRPDVHRLGQGPFTLKKKVYRLIRLPGDPTRTDFFRQTSGQK